PFLFCTPLRSAHITPSAHAASVCLLLAAQVSECIKSAARKAEAGDRDALRGCPRPASARVARSPCLALPVARPPATRRAGAHPGVCARAVRARLGAERRGAAGPRGPEHGGLCLGGRAGLGAKRLTLGRGAGRGSR